MRADRIAVIEMLAAVPWSSLGDAWGQRSVALPYSISAGLTADDLDALAESGVVIEWEVIGQAESLPAVPSRALAIQTR